MVPDLFIINILRDHFFLTMERKSKNTLEANLIVNKAIEVKHFYQNLKDNSEIQ